MVTSASLRYSLTFFVDNRGWESFTKKEGENGFFACVIKQEKRIRKSSYSGSRPAAVYLTSFQMHEYAVPFFFFFYRRKENSSVYPIRSAGPQDKRQKCQISDEAMKIHETWIIHSALSNVIKKQERLRNSTNFM